MSQNNKTVNTKIPSNVEELKRLKQAKKELKKQQNAKPQIQSIAPKVLERVFEDVPDRKDTFETVGSARIMTFNVGFMLDKIRNVNLPFRF